jgi:pimeloyl-ACP methyl ester carboxylesterase
MTNSNRKSFMLAAILAAFVLLAAACAAPVSETTPMAEHETGFVDANGITLAYKSFGPKDGETVLLIAGTGMQLVDWPQELINELVKRGYRVVRFDNRDSGLSTHFTEAGLPDAAAIGKALTAGEPAPLPYTVKDMAGDAVGLLDVLDIQRAHIVGVSMGGAIAQYVAIEYPERTLSLTSLMADSGNPDLPVVAEPEAFEGLPPQPTTVDRASFVDWQVKVWQALDGPNYPTDEATLHKWAERNFERGFDPDGLIRQQTVILVDRFEPTKYRLNNLKNIKAPTIVLQGTDDPIEAVESAKDIAARIPGAELILIPGLGHNLPVELAPTFANAITKVAQQANSLAAP